MDPAEIWRSLPAVTRGYVSLCVITTAACALEVRSRAGRAGGAIRDGADHSWAAPRRPARPCPAASAAAPALAALLIPACHGPSPPQIITPFNIYFNAKLIWQQREYWRLFTNFFYFGSLGAGRGGSSREGGCWCHPACVACQCRTPCHDMAAWVCRSCAKRAAHPALHVPQQACCALPQMSAAQLPGGCTARRNVQSLFDPCASPARPLPKPPRPGLLLPHVLPGQVLQVAGGGQLPQPGSRLPVDAALRLRHPGELFPCVRLPRWRPSVQCGWPGC